VLGRAPNGPAQTKSAFKSSLARHRTETLIKPGAINDAIGRRRNAATRRRIATLSQAIYFFSAAICASSALRLASSSAKASSLRASMPSSSIPRKASSSSIVNHRYRRLSKTCCRKASRSAARSSRSFRSCSNCSAVFLLFRDIVNSFLPSSALLHRNHLSPISLNSNRHLRP